jgi:hypothetical protein
MSGLPEKPVPHGNRIAGDLVGSQLVPDPKTGFLQFVPQVDQLGMGGKGGSVAVGFTSEKKLKFLEVLSTCWPNVTKAARTIGVSRKTVVSHLQIDVKFAECFQEIVDEKMDEVEGHMMRHAKSPKQYMDRITLLRANRPQIYDPAKRLIIERGGERETADQAKARMVRVQDAVDTDVVSAQLPESSTDTSTPGDQVDKSA